MDGKRADNLKEEIKKTQREHKQKKNEEENEIHIHVAS